MRTAGTSGDALEGDGMRNVAAATRPQRAEGRGHLSAKVLDGRTRLRELYQEGAAKIRLPDTFDSSMEAVIINTAGGLTGGDRMNWSIDAGPDTRIDVTTQACEKIYKASSGTAEVNTTISVGAKARVDWLPQETILFDRSQLFRRLDVDLEDVPEFLAVEAILLGRKAMGEAVETGLFRDRWRIRKGGTLCHAEDLQLSGDVALAHPGRCGARRQGCLRDSSSMSGRSRTPISAPRVPCSRAIWVVPAAGPASSSCASRRRMASPQKNPHPDHFDLAQWRAGTESLESLEPDDFRSFRPEI